MSCTMNWLYCHGQTHVADAGHFKAAARLKPQTLRACLAEGTVPLGFLPLQLGLNHMATAVTEAANSTSNSLY